MIIYFKVSVKRYHNLFFRFNYKLQFNKFHSQFDFRGIPVIINNFNRLSFLQKQIEWFEKVGMSNIYIIDNSSTYKPLIDFYKTTKHVVYRLDKNIGHDALWKTILFQKFRNEYYVYTDPDILPVEECPIDAIEYFYSLLNKYPDINKVGFGLKIDDLPDCYPLKQKVIKWESQFWTNPIEPHVYSAPIDTTFALYRPGAKGGSDLKALRTGDVYSARHLSWYINTDSLSEEDLYYMKHAGSSSSWNSELLGRERSLKY
jgi:hypothetical protein